MVVGMDHEKKIGDKYWHPTLHWGEVTNVVYYPDGDFHFYVVKFDENFVECMEEDMEEDAEAKRRMR
jgi:hypothetical protein